jgi:hypothetical protein
VSHPVATIRCFGWVVFFRALFLGRGSSFLTLLRSSGLFEPSPSQIPDLAQHCVELELRAMRIYKTLAEQVTTQSKVREFLTNLAQQEQDHANLLEAALVSSRLGRWQGHFFEPWRDCIPRLEEQMQRIAASLGSISTLDEALEVIIQIELSEINQIFQAVLAASDSIFVRRLKVFQDAMNSHIAYIVERLAEFGATLPQTQAGSQSRRKCLV